MSAWTWRLNWSYRKFFRDWPLKILSVIIALGLWFIISQQNVIDRILEIALQYRIEDTRIVILQAPQKVTVTVRGPAPVVRNLSPEQFSLVIPVESQSLGDRLIPLSPDMVQHRIPRVEVVRLHPAQVTLRLDVLTRKAVPVQPQFVGTLAPGFQLAQVTVTPSTVIIEGPASMASRVHAAYTEPLNIHMRRQNLQTTVRVGVPLPEWRVVEPQEVQVRVIVHEILDPVRVRLTVETNGFSQGWGVQPQVITGIFWVPRSQRPQFEQNPPRASVQMPENPRPGMSIPVTIELPEVFQPIITRWTISPDTVLLVRLQR